MKLGVIFGSKSTEREISIVSASSIINNLDRKKYDIYPIYLDENNNFYEALDMNHLYKIGGLPKKLKKINDIFSFLKKLDVVFPVLHGKYGEDGAIQGLLELLQIPYVGCGILASAIAMDKIYTKTVLKTLTNVAKDICIKKINNKMYYYADCIPIKSIKSINEIHKMIEVSFGYPVFIKPSRFGSSVGITKASNKKELTSGLKLAFQYDLEVLIEEEIKGRELECAVLDGKALSVGEVLAADAFYSYEAKYQNEESKTIIPADIPQNIEEEIKSLAEKAFATINGDGLARVDFFYDDAHNKLYLNEINTMPGFTEISMYKKLAEASNISYSNLLEQLIKIAKTSK